MKETKRRAKPPVASINEESAVQNIERKIALLESWVRDEIPYMCNEAGDLILSDAGRRQLDYFPTTLRQFNFWNGTQNCKGTQKLVFGLRRNANDTLRRYQPLRKAVETLLVEIVRKANAQRRADRPEIIAQLKRQQEVERSRINRLEVELVEHRKQVKVLAEENKRLNKINKEISQKSHEAISLLEEEVAKLNEEKSMLNKKLLKLIPLKKVR